MWLTGLVVVAALAALPASAFAAGDDKRVCAYSEHSIAKLQAFGRMVHRNMDCAVVYTGTSNGWAGWESPWFLHATADSAWGAWATAPGTGRRLIITQDLFPAILDNTAWRAPGAAGAYTGHARALARNLVAAGLGGATIRLAPEANGTWYPDSIGYTPQDFAQWRAFWRQTVLAMRSVPGAHFEFDWCVHAVNRPIPPPDWYPGDDVVDFVGIDTYDVGLGMPAGPTRWSALYNRGGSIGSVVSFARAHNKLLSIPEWGLSPGSSDQGGGDDPYYVNGIADVVRHNRTSYQAYFYKYAWASQLSGGALSLAAYRSHFGDGGDTGPGTLTPVVAAARAGVSRTSRAAVRAELRSRVNALARGGWSALVRHSKLRRSGWRMLLPTRAPVGATACLLAVTDSGRVGAPSGLTLRARARSRCGKQAWTVGARRANVLAAGSRVLAAGRAAKLALRLHGRGLSYMRARRRVRMTVVAVIVPRTGSAVVASVQRRSIRAR